jgi:hypothetical protein
MARHSFRGALSHGGSPFFQRCATSPWLAILSEVRYVTVARHSFRGALRHHGSSLCQKCAKPPWLAILTNSIVLTKSIKQRHNQHSHLLVRHCPHQRPRTSPVGTTPRPSAHHPAATGVRAVVPLHRYRQPHRRSAAPSQCPEGGWFYHLSIWINPPCNCFFLDGLATHEINNSSSAILICRCKLRCYVSYHTGPRAPNKIGQVHVQG